RFVQFWMSSGSEREQKFVFYEVYKNESAQVISKDLEKLGIVSNARFFYWYGRLTGKNGKFKAGDYRFSTRMRPDDVMGIIMSGISYGFPLTVPEGYNMQEISELIDDLRPGSGARFLKFCSDRKFIANLPEPLKFSAPPATLEGYLFPDTYLVGRKM